MISARGPRLADLELRWSFPIAAALAVLTVPVLLYLGRRLNFFGDEWTFIFVRRGSGATVFFGPHNEHWSTIPVLIYRALFATVGLRSYLPYLLMLELLHAGCALLLFAIIRRRVGAVPALASMLLFLFLGRGAENILWAFQIGFVGSVFCGLLAILLLDPPEPNLARAGAASIVLIASLMFSGVGLFFCGAIGVDLLIDRRRRPMLLALVLPALAYLLWFFTFGLLGVTSHRSPFSLSALLSLVGFVPFGLGTAIAGVGGLSSRWALGALAVAGALGAVIWFRRGRVDSRVVGALAGVLLQFALTGLVRAQFGVQQAAASKYVYVAAAFLLPVAADVVRDWPWRGMLGWAMAAAFAFALVDGAIHLRTFAHDRDAIIMVQTAELQTLAAFRGAPDMSLNQQIDPAVMPVITAAPYFAAVDALGSPVPAVSVGGLAQLPGTAVNQAMVSAFGEGVRVSDSGPAPGTGCRGYQAGSQPYIDLMAPSRSGPVITAAEGGVVDVWLSYLSDPVGVPQRQLALPPGVAKYLATPDTGTAIVWRLRVTLPQAGTMVVCP